MVMSVRSFLAHPAIKALCSIVVLLVISRLLDWNILIDAFRRYDAVHLMIAGVAAMAILFFLALRWALMASEIVPHDGVRHFRNFLFGICISSVTPANVGADLYRFAALHAPGQKWRIIGLLVQEKVLLLVGYFLVVLVTLGWATFGDESLVARHAWPLAALASLAVAGAAAPFVFPRLADFILRRGLLKGRLAAGLAGFSRLVDLGRPRRFLPLLALTALSIFAWLAAVTAVSSGLGIGLSLPLIWLTAIIADMARWAPFSLQGIGVREGAFAGMFLFFGADPSLGFAVGGVAYLMLTFAMIAAGGVALAIDAVMSLIARLRPSGESVSELRSER
jgi:glycosyltransferase 2 family protein